MQRVMWRCCLYVQGCLEWIATSDAMDGTSELPGAVPEGFWSVNLRDIKIGSESMLRCGRGARRVVSV